MQKFPRLRRFVRRWFRGASAAPASPVKARHYEPSGLFSMDDDPARPSARLFDAAMNAVEVARTLSLDSLRDRVTKAGEPIFYPAVWPGEHYRLLAALVQTLKPDLVVEIGTATGLSALSLLEKLPASGRVVTFDVIPWNEYGSTVLKEGDFESGRLEQRIADLTYPTVCRSHAELLIHADLIFIDAAKDGVQEQRFLENLRTVAFRRPPLIIFDDIRVWNMLRIWRDIRYPKLDLTSFGHWSGTGLVDFTLAT